MNYLITGAAGFIGFHVAQQLLDRGDTVVGFDSVNAYYDPQLKESRLNLLASYPKFSFVKGYLENQDTLEEVFKKNRFDRVIHLAAQAGVRYSLENPLAYGQSNLIGFMHILEACKKYSIPHLVYASSSSVYGGNTKMPFSEKDPVDHPVSLYAATKRCNELLAHTYAHLFGLPCTGLRFFTVYGPWGRPDMACFLFTKAILEDRPISVFNHGKMRRDFTYIDDVVQGILKTAEYIPSLKTPRSEERISPHTSWAPFQVFNIGNHQPVDLLYFIEVLESELGKKAKKNLLPMQPGDVAETYADIEELQQATGFQPTTPIETGLRKFVQWYQSYYK